MAGQTSGNEFEGACCDFINATFKRLNHLRPGKWQVVRLPQRDRVGIARFEQYAHLSEIARMCKENTELATVIGSDYLICPDIVIIRDLEEDSEINRLEALVDDKTANRASLRKTNGGKSIIHASISCKWTIRSDRVQNSRAEALNLMRNRKGHLPHIIVVTSEPLPSRLASIALGTGDIDMIYHFALPELIESVHEIDSPDSLEMMRIMLEGKRLRDISDLPLVSCGLERMPAFASQRSRIVIHLLEDPRARIGETASRRAPPSENKRKNSRRSADAPLR